MTEEYRIIVASGLLLQLDCPDLAMAAHIAFQDLSEAEFLKPRRAACRGDELRARRDRCLAGAHACLLGQLRGGRTTTISRSTSCSASWPRRSRRRCCSRRPNARHEHEWSAWKDAPLPDDKILVPGMIDTCSNYVGASRAGGAADRALGRSRRARAGDRGHRLRFRDLRRATASSTWRSRTRSCGRWAKGRRSRRSAYGKRLDACSDITNRHGRPRAGHPLALRPGVLWAAGTRPGRDDLFVASGVSRRWSLPGSRCAS